MQKSSAAAWDWLSAGLMFLLIQAAAARLVITGWAPFLYFTETFSALGTVLGLTLGFSRFQKNSARWLAIAYTLVLFPWQLTGAVEVRMAFGERLLNIGERLLFSLGQFIQRQVVKDTLFFVAVVALAFWIIGLTSAYQLVRHGKVLASILPAGTAIVLIQIYDNYDQSRSWWLAVYIFIALLLLGRRYYLSSQASWSLKRVFVSEEAWSQIFNGLLMTTAVTLLVAWSIPTSVSSWQSASDSWNRATQPIRDRLSNAVKSLESPYGSGGINFNADRLALGRNAAQGDTPAFTVRVLSDPGGIARYYWRGRVYDSYNNGQWSISAVTHLAFFPGRGNLDFPDSGNRSEARFLFTMDLPQQSLLYLPSQPVWVSRNGNISVVEPQGAKYDVVGWELDSALNAGGQVQARASVARPTIRDLRGAGSVYPQWVEQRYLQVPAALAPEFKRLAQDIVGEAQTPFDKAQAITSYLRNTIQYSATIDLPPAGRDPLLWVLTDYKKGFCNYYASAEVILLRSIGIPARLAVGFAQGKYDSLTQTFTILHHDAHAWPEAYFPGIGWVEFEPTAAQEALARPEGENTAQSGTGPGGRIPPLRNSDRSEPDLAPDGATPDGANQSTAPFSSTQTGRLLTYLLPALAALLLIVLARRTRLIDRLPVYLTTSIERLGLQTPGWIRAWARWNELTPAEHSFMSINFSLNWLGQPQPIHATPAERAAALARRLPSASAHIQALTSEHESALYSPRPADLSRARRAGWMILLHALRARLRQMLGVTDVHDVYLR